MASAVIKAIESYSSEDPNFPASNLLGKGNKKWKCHDPGETNAFVVLRLEKPTTIIGIDIGNEHSAFIEVLVSRTGPANPQFTEILLTSSFMTPIESRYSATTSRVRCFNAASLVAAVAGQKWDLVKIICTQPFNPRVRYGLTFVTIHVNAGNEKETEKQPLVPDKFQQEIRNAANQTEPPKPMNFGRFKLREESPESDDAYSSGKLFARWKESRGKPATPSTAAAIRDASATLTSSPAVNRSIKTKPKVRVFDADDEDMQTKPKRSRDSLLYSAEDEQPNERLEKKMANDRAWQQAAAEAKKAREMQKKTEPKVQDTSSSFKEFLSVASEQRKEARKEAEAKVPTVTPTRKAHTSVSSAAFYGPPKKSPSPGVSVTANKAPKSLPQELEQPQRSVLYKPFDKLLENVTLVISGIQNPDRANLRTQALSMGARYKSDWDSSCTHLICAFRNTPKYNQVRGKGKIIKKDWIERCYAVRKRLSWRKFALDREECEKSDSEDEVVELVSKPSSERDTLRSVSVEPKETDDEVLGLYELDYENKHRTNGRMTESVDGSGSDTEEDIDKVLRHQKPVDKSLYDKSTEEEGPGADESSVSLDFYRQKKFMLDEALEAVDIIKLERYIEQYKGSVTRDVREAHYIVTRNSKGPPPHFKGELVKPLWIYECSDMECLIPTRRYHP